MAAQCWTSLIFAVREVPLSNAFSLGYFWEYRYKSYITGGYILSPTFWLQAVCDWLQLQWHIWPQSYRIAGITQNNGQYTVQGHSSSSTAVPIESSYAASNVWIIVIYLLYRLGDMVDYWSNFRCRLGVSLFNALVGSKPLNWGLLNLASWN